MMQSMAVHDFCLVASCVDATSKEKVRVQVRVQMGDDDDDDNDDDDVWRLDEIGRDRMKTEREWNSNGLDFHSHSGLSWSCMTPA